MATFLAIKEEALRRLAWTDEHVGLLPIPLTTTSTAADTLSLRDTALARGSHGAGNYNGRHIEIVEAVSGGPALGEIAAVDDAGFDQTDKLTTSPAFTDEVQSGTDYLMYPRLLVPEALGDAINGVLRRLWVPCFFPLSLHICTNDENDMETAPATTFTDYKTNATLTNGTCYYNGAQALSVVASAAGGYVYLEGMYVNEGMNLYAGIYCEASSAGSGTFRVYDATNGETIDDATTGEQLWTSLVVPFTVPSGCEVIHCRCISDIQTPEWTLWDDYQVWAAGEALYPAPSWITDPRSQIIDVVEFPPGAAGPGGDNEYRVRERGARSVDWGIEEEDPRAGVPFHIRASGLTSARPYILAYRPCATLSALTDTTPADLDYVAPKAVARILKNRGAPEWRQHDEDAERRARQLHYGRRDLRSVSPTVLV